MAGGDDPVLEADERRMTAGIRVLLSGTVLAATAIDPSEPSRFAAFTYAALALYLGYAVLVYAVVRSERPLSHRLEQALPIIDVGSYAALIGLSGGSNSIYFVLFFFGILTASFRGGLGDGVMVTAISVALFAVVGYMSRPPDPDFDLNRFLVRLVTLPVLGYLIAYRGGYERRLRRRLALLREISVLSNPRFGPHRMLVRALDRLRAFFDGDLALAILPLPGGGHEVRMVTRQSAGTVPDPQPLPQSMGECLLGFGHDEVVCVPPGASRDAVADRLGAPAYLTVPLRMPASAPGRLYVAGTAPRFAPGDGDFLLQAADQIMPALAHVTLIERMATQAADDERRRIALDLHDRIIQPHLGLQIGLSAAEQLAASSAPDVLPAVRDRLHRLSELAALGMADLRGYMSDLHGEPRARGGLPDALRRFAARFQDATGIQVTVQCEDDLSIDERLAAEVFSMASEGVSNVRRHTNAPAARVLIRRSDEHLVLRVENAGDPDAPAAPFVPRSIAGRAAAANGTVKVESHPLQGTAVIVDIPL